GEHGGVLLVGGEGCMKRARNRLGIKKRRFGGKGWRRGTGKGKTTAKARRAARGRGARHPQRARPKRMDEGPGPHLPGDGSLGGGGVRAAVAVLLGDEARGGEGTAAPVGAGGVRGGPEVPPARRAGTAPPGPGAVAREAAEAPRDQAAAPQTTENTIVS